VQFVFFEQWKCLKNYANKKGIYIAGDIPYNVDFESADLWENPQLFEVDPVSGKTILESGAPPDDVIYTETHDLKPMVGWCRDLNPAVRKQVEEYLGVPVTERNVHWEFVRLALSSVAKWSLISAQDLLGLGSEARMNITGVLCKDNWRWRLTSMKSLDPISEQLFNLTRVYGRLPA
jgi:4-alpha-glucanotransferase